MVIVKYKKKDEGMFFSHLNVMRIWGRIMAISGIDVVDAPNARERKMVFSGPTSVGVESSAEYILLNVDLDEHEVENAIENNLPKWIELDCVKNIKQKISLMCDAAEYKISFDDYKSCKGRIKDFFSRDNIEITAMVHGTPQKLDVKERIFDLSLNEGDMSLVCGIGNNSAHIVELVKDLLAFLKIHSDFEIKKVSQFVRRDGKLVDLDNVIKE